MSRSIFVAFLSVALFAAISCAAIENELSSNLEVVAVGDGKHFVNQNHGVELLEEFESGENRLVYRYLIGEHVAGTIVAIFLLFRLIIIRIR